MQVLKRTVQKDPGLSLQQILAKQNIDSSLYQACLNILQNHLINQERPAILVLKHSAMSSKQREHNFDET